MKFFPFTLLALFLASHLTLASAEPIPNCVEAAAKLTSKKWDEFRFESFRTFYKSKDVTPAEIQNEATRVVTFIAQNQDAFILGNFLLDLDFLKAPSRFYQMRRFRKYGSFYAFDAVKAFVNDDGTLAFPPHISEESRLVLLAGVARHIKRDDSVLLYDKRTRLFIELIAALKIKTPSEGMGQMLLLKKRLAYEIVRAYVENLGPVYGIAGADKVLISRELQTAIKALPLGSSSLENFNEILLDKIAVANSPK